MSVEQEINDLIPAFAIGITDNAETEQIKKYLQGNPAVSAEIAEYSQMAEALLFAVPFKKAPADLESRLLSAIAPVAEVKSTGSLPQATEPLPCWKRIFTPTLAPQWVLAGAALAMMVLLNSYWIRQVNGLQETQMAMQEQLLQQETTLSVIAMDDMQRTVLPSVSAGELAKADIIWGEGFEVALVYVEDFPQLELGKVYQLWLIKDEKRTSGGQFTVNEHGTGTLIVQLAQPLDEYDSLGITIEPEGGSEVPTSPPVVRGSVKN